MSSPYNNNARRHCLIMNTWLDDYLDKLKKKYNIRTGSKIVKSGIKIMAEHLDISRSKLTIPVFYWDRDIVVKRSISFTKEEEEALFRVLDYYNINMGHALQLAIIVFDLWNNRKDSE